MADNYLMHEHAVLPTTCAASEHDHSTSASPDDATDMKRVSSALHDIGTNVTKKKHKIDTKNDLQLTKKKKEKGNLPHKHVTNSILAGKIGNKTLSSLPSHPNSTTKKTSTFREDKKKASLTNLESEKNMVMFNIHDMYPDDDVLSVTSGRSSISNKDLVVYSQQQQQQQPHKNEKLVNKLSLGNRNVESNSNESKSSVKMFPQSSRKRIATRKAKTRYYSHRLTPENLSDEVLTMDTFQNHVVLIIIASNGSQDELSINDLITPLIHIITSYRAHRYCTYTVRS